MLELRRQARDQLTPSATGGGAMTSVAVVGGGITGLSAARLLPCAGIHVIVLEAGNGWGGKLCPVAIDGVTPGRWCGVDAGASPGGLRP